ncbi:MAG: hypothetical protein AAGA75_24890 [Cyanobacteria bacterium P01_E01_bin.6]
MSSYLELTGNTDILWVRPLLKRGDRTGFDTSNENPCCYTL